MKIQTKRVYDSLSRMDGYRVLVDRLWPRGISKADASLDEWCKNLAPSSDLRKWFGHDPDRWAEFSRWYAQELDDNKDQIIALLDRCTKKTITLVYAARDADHNHAIVLKRVMETYVSS